VPPETQGRPRGALEREILACLAAADQPLSPAEVRAELGGDLAYTTVMTTLSRLHDKGAVSRAPAGRGYSYALRGDPDGALASMTARRMLRLLEAGADRAGVLSRFVADLTSEDEQLLNDLLADAAGPAGPGSGPGQDARRAAARPAREAGPGGETGPG
jgi:predicted transcriptional regulator